MIGSSPTFGFDDLADAVKEALEARVGGALVVDELDLDRLHGRDGEDGLADSGAQAAEQPGARRQVTALVHRQLLELLERPEPEPGRRHEENATAARLLHRRGTFR